MAGLLSVWRALVDAIRILGIPNAPTAGASPAWLPRSVCSSTERLLARV